MIYFTPGPSQLYPTVKKHIHQAIEDDIPSLSHRSEKFHTIVKESYDSLRKLLDIPENYQIFHLASATEAMERIIENCVADKSFHFVNGSFAKRFYQIALDLKKHPVLISSDIGKGFEVKKVKIPLRTEVITITHTETSGGTAFPLTDITYLRKTYPKSLIAIDIVSSVPYVNLDFQSIDCIFFSVQKGFGLPAGLGVLIVSPKAMKKALVLTKKGLNVGSYHKFQTLSEHAAKYQTIETPNVLGIYLFHKVLQDFLKKGVKQIREETDEKAKMLYDFFDSHPRFKPFVKDKRFRSNTVIVIGTPTGSKSILANLKDKGFTVGSGYGDMKEKQIRIANFPAIQRQDIKVLLQNFKTV